MRSGSVRREEAIPNTTCDSVVGGEGDEEEEEEEEERSAFAALWVFVVVVVRRRGVGRIRGAGGVVGRWRAGRWSVRRSRSERVGRASRRGARRNPRGDGGAMDAGPRAGKVEVHQTEGKEPNRLRRVESSSNHFP